MWALLVSCQKYRSDEWDDLQGAHQDSDRYKAYLVNKLNVPGSHIVQLKDEHAMRSNVISTFRTHLIDNKAIRHGEALLFHFSGHGSRGAAPKGWAVEAVLDESDGKMKKEVETILPHDTSSIDDKPPHIPPIPDRTLGRLIAHAAKAHGDNITIILDCCHSGHGTRGKSSDSIDMDFPGELERWKTRGVEPSRVAVLPDDVDDDILMDGETRGHHDGQKLLRRGGFSNVTGTKHVLLAGCGPFQSSNDGQSGGLFSRILVKTLESSHAPNTLTYSAVRKGVDNYFRTFFSSTHQRLRALEEHMKEQKIPQEQIKAELDARRPHNQEPQFEGPINRLLFQTTTMDSDVFMVSVSAGDCTVDAGEVHGIQIGTRLQLYEARAQSRYPICDALVYKASSTQCHVRLPAQYSTAVPCVATVLQHSYSLKVAISRSNPRVYSHLSGLLGGSDRSTRTMGTAGNLSASTWQIVGDEHKADLLLEPDAHGGIALIRRDRTVGSLTTAPPKIRPEDVRRLRREDFSDIFQSISRFNAYLALAPAKGPAAFGPHVDLELHLLDEGHADRQYGDNFNPVHRSKEKILFEHGEAILKQGTVDKKYAFLLRNNSATPLFPYIVYFDPMSYEISVWYSPPYDRRPPLPAHGTLQVGASPEAIDPFEFFVPDNATRDTSFIKVFLLESWANMEFLNQQQVLRDYDEEGYSSARHRIDDSGEMGSTWDAFVRKITVVHESAATAR